MKAYFKQLFDTIQIELQIIDLEGCDISLDESVAMIEFLKKCFLDLRNFLLAKEAMAVEEEITCFKEMKPEVLGQLLYFHKIHNIELNGPTGSNDTQKEYYESKLSNITYSGGKVRFKSYDEYNEIVPDYDTMEYVRGMLL